MNAFVDTNILVYAADEAIPQSGKSKIARELLLQPDLHLSVQVLSEFVVTARNSKKLGFSLQQEKEWLERWLLFPIAPLGVNTFVDALSLHHRFQISHWDSLIIAAAKEQSCEVLYSENLNAQQDYDGLKVVNPFG